jgi:regulator of protease activity HflC (stomatin/prohibitin superfamily)
MRWLKYWVAYAWWRVRAFAFDHFIKFVLTVLILVAVAVYYLPDIVVTINAGESGVLWKRFGGGTVTADDSGRPFRSRISTNRTGDATTLTEEREEDRLDDQGFERWPYDEGMHLKWPWDKIFTYNIRLQETTTTYDALTNDGLAITTEVTIRWKPIEEDLGKLHREIGPDYVKTMLIPLVGSYARQEIAAQRPDALYSPERLAMQERIRDRTKQALVARFHPEQNRESYLLVEDVLIRNVTLPDEVAEAIEDKVIQKQESEAYEYRLARERQEAERKAIEADGIRRFQETINSTISEGYLRWKGIEATLELAKSNNAKVVVVGAGEQGLPIILGGLDGVGSPTVATAPPPPPAAPRGAGPAAAGPAGAARAPASPTASPTPTPAAATPAGAPRAGGAAPATTP